MTDEPKRFQGAVDKLTPDCKPRYLKCKAFTDEWWAAQQKAFATVMVENPEIRPVNYDELDHNSKVIGRH